MNMTQQEKKIFSRMPCKPKVRVDLLEVAHLFVLMFSVFLALWLLSSIANDYFYSMDLGQTVYASEKSEALREFCAQVEVDWKGKELPQSLEEACGV